MSMKEEAYFTKSKYKGKQYGKYSQNNKKLNPLNKIGKVSRCLICDSKMHWADHCPHKSDHAALVTEIDTESDQENCEEVNVALMTQEYTDFDKSEVFVAEASKPPVIDTACTKTVAGNTWFENFKSNLTEKTFKEIEIFPSNTNFKFGDGRKVKSLNCVIFLVVIAISIAK